MWLLARACPDLARCAPSPILSSYADAPDRRHVAQREFPATEDDMDERAPNPAVSVGEGMDGLELCVRDGSL